MGARVLVVHTALLVGSPLTPARRAALAFARAFAVLAALGMGASILGDLWWVFDLATHFRLHLLLAAALALALSLLIGRRAWSLLAASVVVYSVVSLWPFWTARPPPPGSDSPTLQIVQFNLLTTNLHRDEVTKWLAESEADVLIVEEIDDAWLESLKTSMVDYEIAAAVPRDDRFGIVALVRRRARGGRLERVDTEVLQLDGERDDGVPALGIRARFAGRELSILGVHTLPPVSSEYAATRHRQLLGAGQWAVRERAKGRAPLVVGDLNATPFCSDFQLVTAAGLLDSARGRGYAGSFPAYLPAALALPIDHVLHDGTLTVVEHSHGPDLGSDHRPLRVVLAWG